ncbi:MAG TPA: histidine phosphatase family protein [Vicinamibacteria bacterium]|nr:histidine phosphatase family protein [Vicinamibacteria bacterium]
MRLIVIRHAIAVDRSPDIPDDARPLTQEGKKRFRQAARGLARLFPPPDLLLSSPLLRARQTARIASKAWRVVVTEEVALGGGSVSDLQAALRRVPAQATVAMVGHEPQLSEFLAHILGSSQPDRLTFKKGGAAVVDLPAGPDSAASLLAVLPPRILRRAG